MRPTWRPLRSTSAKSAKDSAAASNDGGRTASRAILPKTAGEQPWEQSRRLRRRGKKIPATGGAMADRFLVVDRSTADGNGPGCFRNRPGAGTSRARLVV